MSSFYFRTEEVLHTTFLVLEIDRQCHLFRVYQAGFVPYRMVAFMSFALEGGKYQVVPKLGNMTVV